MGPDPSLARRLVQRSGTAGAEVSIAMSPCLASVAASVADTLRGLGYRVVLETDGPLAPPALLVRRPFAGRRRLLHSLAVVISIRCAVPGAAHVVRRARGSLPHGLPP